SAASSVRKSNKLRNRLPLPGLTVALDDSAQLEPFTAVIRDEVNVKEVTLTDDVDAVGTFEVVVNAKVAGPRLGRDVQTVIKAVKSGDYQREGETVVAGGIELNDGEFTERLVAADPASTAAIDGLGGLVVLDMTVTEELEAEGWAADVIRGLQDARKAEDFAVSDRIATVLSVPADKKDWAERHAEHIAAETLSTGFTVTVDEITEGTAHQVVKGVQASVVKQS
ncbi:MAG: DUF5915 domain-containing protein, partial [Corynebacterium sp.]|nr:DUF5915 domain-containing protein [Corynebacterium sp.]